MHVRQVNEKKMEKSWSGGRIRLRRVARHLALCCREILVAENIFFWLERALSQNTCAVLNHLAESPDWHLLASLKIHNSLLAQTIA